jgi:hypothetical protein
LAIGRAFTGREESPGTEALDSEIVLMTDVVRNLVRDG